MKLKKGVSMDDRILYTLVNNGGGMDGMDHTDNGGKIMAASFQRAELEKNPNAPWCTIRAEVITFERIKGITSSVEPVVALIISEYGSLI